MRQQSGTGQAHKLAAASAVGAVREVSAPRSQQSNGAVVLDEHRVNSCLTCPVGRSSAVGQGGRCPFVTRTRHRGEFIYFEGEPASCVWFVKRGTVVLARTLGGAAEEESARAIRSAGSFVGLEALVRPAYIDTARATTEVTLCAAARDAVDQWLGPAGSPARVALEQVLDTLCADAPRAASPDGNAVRRVARWLLDESHDGVAPQVPRRFVASLLGMVPETFSRALTQLARGGAVEVTRRTLRIRDRRALMAVSRV